MEELLKAAFEAGKDLGHSMATGKPTYGQNFNEWYASQALRIHDVVGRSEQLEPYEPDNFPKCVLCKSIHDPEICCQD